MKIVFMGTPDFAVPSLCRLIAEGHEVCLVVTQPDRPGNRGKVRMSPVKETAVNNGVPVLQPVRIKRDEEAVQTIRSCTPDMIVVAAFGQILPREVLDIPRYGCINVHGSLLPAYRGASPMQHAILSGDDVTGVTIMRMEEGLDTGDMVLKAELDIRGKDITEVSTLLAELGADTLITAIKSIEDGSAVYTKQDDLLSSYAPMIKKDDGLTGFTEPADMLVRKLRAYADWPTLHSYLNGQLVKIYAAEAVQIPEKYRDKGYEPGEVVLSDDNSIYVKCGGDDPYDALRVTELQLQGKRRMRTEDFLRGYRWEERRFFRSPEDRMTALGSGTEAI